MERIDPDDAEKLLHGLVTGAGLGQQNPVLVLRNMLAATAAPPVAANTFCYSYLKLSR